MISMAQISTQWERLMPSLCFLVGAIIGCLVSIPEEKLFLSTIATIGVLLSSLGGVCITNFLSLETEVAKALQKNGYYIILMNYGKISVLLSLFLSLFALSGFLVPNEYKWVYEILLFGMLLSACGAFYRIFWLLTKIGGFENTLDG